jgi:hypothetical protein
LSSYSRLELRHVLILSRVQDYCTELNKVRDEALGAANSRLVIIGIGEPALIPAYYGTWNSIRHSQTTPLNRHLHYDIFLHPYHTITYAHIARPNTDLFLSFSYSASETTGLRNTVIIYTDSSRSLHQLFGFSDTLEGAAPADPKRAYVTDIHLGAIWKWIKVCRYDHRSTMSWLMISLC